MKINPTWLQPKGATYILFVRQFHFEQLLNIGDVTLTDADLSNWSHDNSFWTILSALI